jgi:Membrane bound O-acyl transferase family
MSRTADDSTASPEVTLAFASAAFVGMKAVVLVAACAIGSTWAIPLLMVGLSLLLHFGVSTLITAALRAHGFPVRVLFDAPLRTRSPAEFWAWRWNRGFAEMTSLAVYRPLVRRLGARGAYLAAFIMSGLLHEVAISLPVRAGYGLPTLYFLLQGWFAQRAGRKPGRLVTMLGIVLPLPLVFHAWFVDGVIAPLLG